MKKSPLVLSIALTGCAAAPLPAAAPPPPPAAPALPPPPWERGSVAEGLETPAPAAPMVILRNATLLLATGKTIARGTLVLDKGKIAAVMDGDVPAAPPGAVVIDATGKFVTPGLIDTHSHLGVYPMPAATAHRDGNEMVAPVTPHAQAADAFWPQDPGIERAAAGGVTAMQVLPGSGNLIGGRAITVKLRPGLSSRAMHFPGAADGLKMACGENPKRVYGGDKKQAPMTRMGNLALQRAAFLSAKKLEREWEKWAESERKRAAKDAKKRAEYDREVRERAAQQAYCRSEPDAEPCEAWAKEWKKPIEEPEASDPVEAPARDPGLETLVAAMKGKVLVHVHCYRADDMLGMLALSDEVGFTVKSFHHALEAYKLRGDLAARGIGVSTWADWWGFKLEAYDGIPENAALVHEAGARAIIHSDSPEGIQRLNQEAAKALASGKASGIRVTEADAIRWITANPAWALGVESRTGTLEVGKDADVVLWDRSPFSVYASAEKVWVDGVLVHDRRAKQKPWSDFELGQDMDEAIDLLPAPGGAK